MVEKTAQKEEPLDDRPMVPDRPRETFHFVYWLIVVVGALILNVLVMLILGGVQS